MAPLVFLMGVGPLARWKQAELPDLARAPALGARRSRWSRRCSPALGRPGTSALVATLGLLMAFWIVARGRHRPVGARCGPAPASAGSVCAALRAAAARDARHDGRAPGHRGVHLRRHDGQDLRGRARREDGRRRHHRRSPATPSPSAACATLPGPNYRAAQGLVEVTRDGTPVATMRPEKRIYRVQQNPMTEAAIDTGLTRDLYVSLGEPVDGSAWIVRVYVQALRRLDLGRLPADGARRPARRQRPALPRRAGASSEAAPARRGDDHARHEAPALPHPAGAVPACWSGFLAVGLKLDPREVPSPLIGKPAPAFALPRLDDAGQDDRAATTCSARSGCSTSGPRGARLPRGAPAAGRVRARASSCRSIGLNYKDDAHDARGWLRSFGNPYDASLFDGDGRVGIDFGVYGVPETFVIDKQRRRSASSTSGR